MWILLRSTIRQLFRDKEALFWSLLFPALFIVIFSFFSFGDGVNAKIILIDNTQDDKLISEVIENLQKEAGAGIYTKETDIEKAKDTLSKSEKLEFEFFDKDEEKTYTEKVRADTLMRIDPPNESTNGQYNITILYDQSEEGQGASPSWLLTATLEDISKSAALSGANMQELFAIERTGIAVNDVQYFDVLVPGIIGMSVMQSGIIGIASGISTLKEKRVLKRLSATPLAIWKFLIANIITHLLLSLVQISIMIILAKFLLGANIYGSIPLIFAVSFFGNFVFLALGFIAAALSSTARAAEGLSQVFTTPMMFLSGVFFERESLPQAIKMVADFLPLSPLLDALRAISLQEAGIKDIQSELLIIVIWTIVASLVAIRIFKFREE